MPRLTAIVLGSAAGGGVPQWNCACPVCRLARQGDPRVKRRTQTSLAVSADRKRWTLLNASPDLRAQLEATAVLHPNGGARGSPVAAVILSGAEIDQAAGLLSLRESQPFDLYAAPETISILDSNSMFGALARDLVSRKAIAANEPFALAGGIEAELFTAPGKVPLYLEGGADGAGQTNVGVELRAGGARLVFVPGVAAMTDDLRRRFAAADAILFDGTLYTDDEMIRLGIGAKTGRRMGHMPIDGPDGSLASLDGIGARRIYIHLNNSNPVLIEGSPERRRVEGAGWEVACDGMEIAL